MPVYNVKIPVKAYRLHFLWAEDAIDAKIQAECWDGDNDQIVDWNDIIKDQIEVNEVAGTEDYTDSYGGPY